MRSSTSRLRYKDLMAFARKATYSGAAATTESGDSSAEDDTNNIHNIHNNTSKIGAFYKDDDDDDDDENGEAVVASVQELHDHDVLCGRDKTSHAHPGNRRFRKIVETYRESYQNAPSREEKTRITGQVVDVIRNSQPPGRFLKYDEGTKTFYDVGDKYAHEKVSHALRSAKDPNRIKPKRSRVVPKREMSASEQEMCERVYEEQQKIFRALVEKSSETNTLFEGDDANDGDEEVVDFNFDDDARDFQF